LQGDVIRTDAAYFLGIRKTGYEKFVALNSSCDLVEGRADVSLILPVQCLRRGEDRINDKICNLTKFALNDCMYIPPLPGESDDIVGNVIRFGETHQIRTQELFLASRMASLSLLGWRIFGAFSRMVFSRTTTGELAFREAIEGGRRVEDSAIDCPSSPMPDLESRDSIVQ
jgi:hypothetical protein